MFHACCGFDHGNGQNLRIRVFDIVTGVGNHRAGRAVAALPMWGVAQIADEFFCFGARIHHGADDPLNAHIQGLHDPTGVTPRHAGHDRGACIAQGLHHGQSHAIIQRAMLHINGDAVKTLSRHDLGGKARTDGTPPIQRRLIPLP